MDYSDKVCLLAASRPEDRYWLISGLTKALAALPDTLKPPELFVRHLLDGLVASGRARHIVGATYRFEGRALTQGERLERALRFGAAAEKAARFRALPVILDRPSALAERRERV